MNFIVLADRLERLAAGSLKSFIWHQKIQLAVAHFNTAYHNRTVPAAKDYMKGAKSLLEEVLGEVKKELPASSMTVSARKLEATPLEEAEATALQIRSSEKTPDYIKLVRTLSEQLSASVSLINNTLQNWKKTASLSTLAKTLEELEKSLGDNVRPSTYKIGTDFDALLKNVPVPTDETKKKKYDKLKSLLAMAKKSSSKNASSPDDILEIDQKTFTALKHALIYSRTLYKDSELSKAIFKETSAIVSLNSKKIKLDEPEPSSGWFSWLA